MAGLNQAPMAQPPVDPNAMPAPMPEQGMPAPAGGMTEGTPASPEEQQMYNRVVSLGMLALFDEEAMPGYLELFKASDDLPGDVGQIVANIVMKVVDFAKQDGTEIPGDVLMHAGMEITEQASELAESAGLPMDDAATEKAFYAALDTYRVMAQGQGDYDPATAQQDMAGIKQMDADGTIERMMQAVGQAQQVDGAA